MAGLKPAFHISHLLDILKDTVEKLGSPRIDTGGAETVDNSSKKWAETVDNSSKKGTETVDNSSKNVVQCCFKHAGEELKIYCETCGELVCLQCVIKGGKHHDHDYALFKVAFEKYNEEITSSLEPIEKQVVIVKKALTELDTRCEEISDQRAAIEGNVHVTFRRLREVLTVRETELIGQLHQMTQAKLKGLAAQRDQIETTLAKLNSCLHFMRESLKTENESDVLTMKRTVVRRVKELTTLRQDMLKPNTEADIVFSALADMTAMCQNYLQVSSSSGSASAGPYSVTGNGLEVAKVGEKSAVILHAINSECEDSIKLLECEIASDITGTRVRCRVDKRGQSHYEISYQPIIKGRHQLHIKVEGQHIRGSPFSVAVKSSLMDLSIPIKVIWRVDQPRGVAVNKKGDVIVTQGAGDPILVSNPSGEKLRSFCTHGSGDGQILRPQGVAVDGEGSLLIVDSDRHCIQKFTAEGQFLASAGTKGSGPKELSSPSGVSLHDAIGKVYVADTSNHRIQVLNSSLTFSSTFGGEGSARGHFSSPEGIACDSTGMVFVADTGNHRIQVFTAEGNWLRMFGRQGKGKGRLEHPNGISVDTSGMVYVSEGSNCRVSVFTSEGRFVTSFGETGKEPMPRRFYFFSGLAVDNSGVVYVCDLVRSCIHVF